MNSKFYFPIVKNPFQPPEDSVSPISTSDGNYLGIIIGASCGVLLLILVIVAAVVVSAHFGLTKNHFTTVLAYKNEFFAFNRNMVGVVVLLMVIFD